MIIPNIWKQKCSKPPTRYTFSLNETFFFSEFIFSNEMQRITRYTLMAQPEKSCMPCFKELMAVLRTARIFRRWGWSSHQQWCSIAAIVTRIWWGITRYNHQKDRNSIQAENETKRSRIRGSYPTNKKKTWIHQQTWWYDQGWSWPILDTLESNLTIYIYIYIIWRYGGFLKWIYGYPKSCMFIGFSINHPCWSTIIFETPFFWSPLPLWQKKHV